MLSSLGGLSGLGIIPFVLGGGVAVVFLFPGSVVMTAAGAAFGLGKGFVAAQVAASAGAALAFLVSRYLARSRVERWVRSKPAFSSLDEAIGVAGWKLVLLTRCCPVFPYVFQNYAYGLTRVSFSHYALGSFIGLVPATLLFVYLGSLGRAGAEAVSGRAEPAQVVFQLLGFAATVAATVYVTRISRQALRRAGI
ncbi:MAG TPA: VTT domain-containing protein [Vicinamibacteria bacterium]|nr:VTT domain-containing protein [Vicinamibacteria bacterium]